MVLTCRWSSYLRSEVLKVSDLWRCSYLVWLWLSALLSKRDTSEPLNGLSRAQIRPTWCWIYPYSTESFFRLEACLKMKLNKNGHLNVTMFCSVQRIPVLQNLLLGMEKKYKKAVCTGGKNTLFLKFWPAKTDLHGWLAGVMARACLPWLAGWHHGPCLTNLIYMAGWCCSPYLPSLAMVGWLASQSMPA